MKAGLKYIDEGVLRVLTSASKPSLKQRRLIILFGRIWNARWDGKTLFNAILGLFERRVLLADIGEHG